MNSLSFQTDLLHSLHKKGLLSQTNLTALLHEESDVLYSERLIERNLVGGEKIAESIADISDCLFANLRKIETHACLFEDITFYLHHDYVPLYLSDNEILVACVLKTDDLNDFLNKKYSRKITYTITSRLSISKFLCHRFSEDLTYKAINDIKENMPQFSASVVCTKKQLVFIFFWVVTFSLLLYAESFYLIKTVLFILSLLLLTFVIFKFILFCKGMQICDLKKNTPEKKILINEFPIYTVLIPLFKEQEVLKNLVEALKDLEYPHSKLDIKLLFEEEDTNTIAFARSLNLPDYFEFIVVPKSFPQSKPKALNYGLQLARGYYLVIYDAEDKPESDQLLKAIKQFDSLPDSYVCLQAKLNFFNVHENWLSKMFTFDYSLWFDFFLPALEHFDFVIPLGGTSNHFKVSALKELSGWDPYNVTEDADLGMRISMMNCDIGLIHSTTFEEANINVISWIKQRSRWLKGYMQTWFVYMRTPIKLIKEIGFKKFLSFQLFIGGTVLTCLLNPILIVTFAISAFSNSTIFSDIFSGMTLVVAFISFMLGNGLTIYAALFSSHHREITNMTFLGLSFPFYGFLQTIAGMKALFEFIYKPFYWHKTPHGITKHDSKKI